MQKTATSKNVSAIHIWWMHGVILLFFVMIICKPTHAAEFTLLNTVDAKNIRFFSSDKLSNFYVIDDAKISKYDANGKFIHSYSNYDFLNFKIIDASNPFKLMLFSAEFLQIRLLDQTLGLGNEIYLNNYQNIGLPLLACVADDNNFWLYDQQNQLLKKIDANGNVLITSNPITAIAEKKFSPDGLVFSGTWLMMRNNKSDLMVFDRYSSFYKNISIDSARFIQASDNFVFYLKEGKLFSLDITLMKTSLVETPDLTGITSIRMEQHRFFIVRKEKIEIYSF